jgi:hypothetical protein
LKRSRILSRVALFSGILTPLVAWEATSIIWWNFGWDRASRGCSKVSGAEYKRAKRIAHLVR